MMNLEAEKELYPQITPINTDEGKQTEAFNMDMQDGQDYGKINRGPLRVLRALRGKSFPSYIGARLTAQEQDQGFRVPASPWRLCRTRRGSGKAGMNYGSWIFPGRPR
jgi:hypothetical protein